MDRRTFLEIAGQGSLAFALTSPLLAEGTRQRGSGGKRPTALEVNAHLRSLCEVSEPSVDRIVIGKPATTVSKIATAWLPNWRTCREAVSRGVNTLVVHEPTFYTHWDLDARDNDYPGGAGPGRAAYLRLRDEKRKWIDDQGLVIIRCHDVLDKVAGFGIPFAFGRALGFADTDLIRSRPYYNVYKVASQPAVEVARHIAQRLKSLRQPGVAFYGDRDYTVRSVGVGTGCICDPAGFMDLEPDLFIAIDDVVRTWVQTTYAEDTGRPLVVVNHGTSEEAGMKLLSVHLRQAFPGVDVMHFDQGCSYEWITA